jgi:hypothetical protein
MKERSEKMESPYKFFKEALEKYPFVIIIGKYDHVLGPKALYSSVSLKNEDFIRNLLRDALNTKNKFVILDFSQFYSQIYKIEVADENARGKKQLYAIILLRDVAYPLIPILHFKRIGMIFHKLGIESILADDISSFESFFKEISEIYMKKGEILPLESTNMQVRSGINTIQGFCELIVEQIKTDGTISQIDVANYIELMLDSCDDIMEALEKPLSTTCK